MAKKAATNKGNCQACGALHKLPNGVLAKHGYTVEWNAFNGVCSGSGHRPYQETYDLIPMLINNAKKSLEEAKAWKDKWSTPITEPDENGDVKAWYRVRDFVGMTMQFVWKQIVLKKEDDCNIYYYLTKDGKKNIIRGYCHGDNIFKAATELNTVYANSNNARIMQLSMYIEWQENRIKEWTKKPLLPL